MKKRLDGGMGQGAQDDWPVRAMGAGGGMESPEDGGSMFLRNTDIFTR
jgi:hypothetical protein